MTGGIAHDFNNLLQVISANIELARDRLLRLGAGEPVLDRLEAASAGVARGARLTRHLLAFARRQTLMPEPLDPARVLFGLEDVLRRTLGEAVELKLVIAADAWTMRADPTQLESALLNLALNARDAMTGPSGLVSGRVTIEVANTRVDEGTVSTQEEVQPGEYVMFTVSDTGIGMTQEQLARALEPFYTTKPEGKGTGLGLPMVFGFAKQSGGHFQLSSKPGQGTRARLCIPRTTAPVVQTPEPATEAGPAGGELVLLVEDDHAVRCAAAAAIRTLGYAVHKASNGDEALRLIEGGLRPALLFTDVVMPGAIEARELSARAKELVPDLAVLFTSGDAQDRIDRADQIGRGLNLLQKPWRRDELARALRTALDSVRHAEPRRILFVEDEPIVRMTTGEVLTELGFEVVEAGTGAEALDRLDPAPHLLMTDLGLPDMDGMALIGRVRALLPGLPVVVSSGRTATPEADVVYLLKPYDARDLRGAVEAALRGEVLCGPIIAE
jgi:CheY-like chemotaxis protein